MSHEHPPYDPDHSYIRHSREVPLSPEDEVKLTHALNSIAPIIELMTPPDAWQRATTIATQHDITVELPGSAWGIVIPQCTVKTMWRKDHSSLVDDFSASLHPNDGTSASYTISNDGSHNLWLLQRPSKDPSQATETLRLLSHKELLELWHEGISDLGADYLDSTNFDYQAVMALISRSSMDARHPVTKDKVYRSTSPVVLPELRPTEVTTTLCITEDGRKTQRRLIVGVGGLLIDDYFSGQEIRSSHPRVEYVYEQSQLNTSGMPYNEQCFVVVSNAPSKEQTHTIAFGELEYTDIPARLRSSLELLAADKLSMS